MTEVFQPFEGLHAILDAILKQFEGLYTIQSFKG